MASAGIVKSTRESLEAALIADPDDLVLHSAYADYLIDEDDPRGEFIRLQLALEDPDVPMECRDSMEREALGLMHTHFREWLGPLADSTRKAKEGGPYDLMNFGNWRLRWRRGWVSSIGINDKHWKPEEARKLRDAIVAAPIAAIMESLILENSGWLGDRLDNFTNLRHLICGYGSDRITPTCGFHKDFAPMTPRMENVAIRTRSFTCNKWFGAEWTRLTSLHFETDFSRAQFSRLFANTAIVDLESLGLIHRINGEARFRMTTAAELYQPPIGELIQGLRSCPFDNLGSLCLGFDQINDAFVRELIATGILRRLKRLDLSGCSITDAGALALAESEDAAKLESLLVDDNYITPVGEAALLKAGHDI